MSKIIVTGAAGFIGSSFTKHLLKTLPNLEILCIDSLDKPLTKQKTVGLGSLSNLSPLNINFKLLDIGKKDQLKELVEYFNPEKIFHFAALSDTRCIDEEAIYNSNILGFENISNLCLENSIDLIFSSSASGYMWNDNEKSFGKSFDTLYAYSKFLNEEYAKKLNSKGLKSWGFRFFNVYGKNEEAKGNTSSVINQIIQHVKEKKVFNLFSDSWDTKRDFVYIDDINNILSKYAQIPNGIYDLGSGEARSFGDVADIIKSLLKEKCNYKLINNPYKEKYQKFTLADMSWIKINKLNIKLTSLEEGIENLIS